MVAFVLYYLSSIILVIMLSVAAFLLFIMVAGVFWAAIKEAWFILRDAAVKLLKNKKNR
ncbi:hypothetical protein [Staphylococcus equorum]|uniref:Uncharacterized protein n=1 Tax=Staphylococcus equorum TaxID=246432 RepID=A0A9X4R2R0_9STAP|nr:hypothetical protein [Staphylococcus equorum]MDG0860381.1 hypothetical protein [Staphylococcus equorum]